MIAFCITCKGRVQHVQETLPKNLDDNPAGELSKFVLLDYNSGDGLREYLTECHSHHLLSGKLVVYSFPEPQVFHMTHAKNMVHRLGIREGADILCNLDADNFTGPFFDSFISEKFKDRGDVFLWAKMFTHPNGKRPRGISGRIVVSAKAFFKLGGYDEKFTTWDHDDKDFNLRLRRAGYEGLEIDQQYLDVVLHTNKMRFKDYPHAQENNVDSNDTVSEPICIIANFGKVGCGTVFRNFDFENPITLAPVPTRIFGIGLHKTGTTSLHTALRRLGFESGHWTTAHWAKAVWDEMQMHGRSWTIEHGYAFSDLPFALLYEQLDRAYPGSKFILTTRNEGEWLKSVENHWSHKGNPFRHQWDHDPFSHRMHKIIYGQKGFDALVFLTRYRQHNLEVLRYFNGRPDLLVMDMSDGSGWPDLCAFLDRPVPEEPYPKKLVSNGP
jgi:hypothetical protein